MNKIYIIQHEETINYTSSHCDVETGIEGRGYRTENEAVAAARALMNKRAEELREVFDEPGEVLTKSEGRGFYSLVMWGNNTYEVTVIPISVA